MIPTATDAWFQIVRARSEKYPYFGFENCSPIVMDAYRKSKAASKNNWVSREIFETNYSLNLELAKRGKTFEKKTQPSESGKLLAGNLALRQIREDLGAKTLKA